MFLRMRLIGCGFGGMSTGGSLRVRSRNSSTPLKGKAAITSPLNAGRGNPHFLTTRTAPGSASSMVAEIGSLSLTASSY